MDWSNLQPPLSVTPTTRRRGVALSRSKANFAALVVWYLLSFTEVYKEGMIWLRSGRTEWIAGLSGLEYSTLILSLKYSFSHAHPFSSLFQLFTGVERVIR